MNPTDTQDSTNQSKKLLLAEDDDALANVYMARLEAEGFTVKRASDGEEALAAAKDPAYRPDLIILDIMMPKISGFEVLEAIRSTPETADIKVMILSALGQEGDQIKAEQLGADDYLVKSQVVTTDVVSRIRKLLGMDDEQQAAG